MLKYIRNITPQVNRSTVFARLGYNENTIADKSLIYDINRWIDDVLHTVKISAVTVECAVAADSAGKISLLPDKADADLAEITSNAFCKFLRGCKKILCIGITAGEEIMQEIENLERINLTKAFVFDAAAGETVDQGIDSLVSLYNKQLMRESKKLFNSRFSPGYGDLSIETQELFYNILEMKKLGVKITESFMLVPQKSIIALTGIV